MEKIKLLITVKTYPTPSTRYREIVCTAGVKQDGSWLRLYPIDYRFKDYSQWYKKYQWIEVDVEKPKQDPRPESYKLVSDIKILSDTIGTKDNWAERKKYVLAKGTKTMCWLEHKQNQNNISLAVIKPKKVNDFVWEKTSNQWTTKQSNALTQLHLFDKNIPLQLEKIPYKFSYKFICEEPDCKGHKMMIEDWEVMELFRKMRDSYEEGEGLKKVKERFLDKICSQKKDTYFFVGTVLQYGKWIIIGTFYPPKLQQSEEQMNLLDFNS